MRMEIKGGEKLQAHLNNLARTLGTKRTLKVGFLEGATYPGEEGQEPMSVATVAAIQNFGNGPIPARPFFTNMVKEKSEEWGPALAGLLEANGFDATNALEVLGEGIMGQLQQSIIDTNEPPLSILTLMARARRKGGGKVTGATLGELAGQMRKGPPDLGGISTKPLVDTGTMLGSVGKEVT